MPLVQFSDGVPDPRTKRPWESVMYALGTYVGHCFFRRGLRTADVTEGSSCVGNGRERQMGSVAGGADRKKVYFQMKNGFLCDK